jgi:hypothetical protein
LILLRRFQFRRLFSLPGCFYPLNFCNLSISCYIHVILSVERRFGYSWAIFAFQGVVRKTSNFLYLRKEYCFNSYKNPSRSFVFHFVVFSRAAACFLCFSVFAIVKISPISPHISLCAISLLRKAFEKLPDSVVSKETGLSKEQILDQRCKKKHDKFC